MARICTIASGSKGNATYISGPSGDILIDAGVSCKALMSAIEQIGDLSKLRGVAITHVHDDHVNGLKTFLKKANVPLIASAETLEGLAEKNLIPPNVSTFVADSGIVTLGDIAIDFFATSHDAKGSGGYVVHTGDGRKAAVCTDLGIMTDDIRQKLLGANAVLIESNHDVDMLSRGIYPPHLKLRILSDEGHLSNGACAVELPALLQGGTTRFVLGHLSENNNTPLLAESSAKSTLAQIGAKIGVDYILEIAKPKTIGVTVF